MKNYLPDGLWAYAFCSAFLAVWDRRISSAWVSIAFLTAVIFEGLQYLHLLAGTGDIYDVAVYFLFFIPALACNNFFKRKFNY